MSDFRTHFRFISTPPHTHQEDNPLILCFFGLFAQPQMAFGTPPAIKRGMENKTTKKEETNSQDKIVHLQKALIEDLKTGRYYGVDQKIRHIQKMVNLAVRI